MITVSPAIKIRTITQKSNHVFSIHWSDGTLADYTLQELQNMCPCAQCQEQPDKKVVLEHLKAKRIVSVGHYGLRIDFNSGCSAGIYSFAMLYKLAITKKVESNETRH